MNCRNIGQLDIDRTLQKVCSKKFLSHINTFLVACFLSMSNYITLILGVVGFLNFISELSFKLTLQRLGRQSMSAEFVQ